ncbi:nucleotidyltransferase family protein [Natronolimnobius sp. AArcel1]|uniref:nucleotidyltransferase family protein n=1 Tax=Natronolimnobius sp. AArcel1 TaxID=1679093 RepID=UPI0013E9C3D0|nr:nucleotidyltransferase family protein [Natronolimnobius sp. AArcel1]NGM70853.1 nucleotidyltransferase family protein [Natronolimnobius sp. AArcel1]
MVPAETGGGDDSLATQPADTEPPVVAAILLAAGTSSRFDGANKLLVPVDGTPIVRHAGRTLEAAPVEPVVAVLGHDADAVGDALAGLDLETVTNPAYGDGQSTSVRCGLEAIPEQADAVMIALGDMPFVDPASITALVDAYRAGAGDALAAANNSERGNPVLFDRQYFSALAALEGDIGGRAILEREGALVETGDPGVRRDVDRRVDIQE